MAVVTYKQAKQSLARGKFPPFLILHGEDQFQARELVRNLRECMTAHYGTVDYLEWDQEAQDVDIYTSLETIPLGATERLVVINNPAVPEIKSYLKIKNPCLVAVLMMENKLKKRDLKALDECWVVECSPLKGKNLINWMQDEARSKGKELPTAAAEYLRFSCGDDPALLSQEIEKASLYLGQKPRNITVGVFQDVGCRTAGRNLFELIDAVAERRGSAALEVFGELMAQGKPPVMLVSMLSRHFLQMLEASCFLREGISPQNLASVMGIHPFVAKKLTKQTRSFSLLEIERILDSILELDLTIKKGKGTPDLLIASFLGEVCIPK